MNVVQQPNGNNKILYTLKGTNGQLYVYENKIEIARKGLLALAQQGLKGTKSIPISQIKSVQVKLCKLSMGFIQFGIGGGSENRGALKDAHTDENTITFSSSKTNALVQEIKNYIENAITNQTTAPNSTNTSISTADEIKRFKELLDMGAITQEEFDAKKKQLLGL